MALGTDRYGNSRAGWGWNDSLGIYCIHIAGPVWPCARPSRYCRLYDSSSSQYWNFPILFEATAH